MIQIWHKASKKQKHYLLNVSYYAISPIKAPHIDKNRPVMIKQLSLIALTISLCACSGMRTTDTSFSTHAENFNFLYLQIPGGDTHERALAMLPEGAKIDTFYSTPHDNTSLLGVISRIIGIEHTTITGRIEK